MTILSRWILIALAAVLAAGTAGVVYWSGESDAWVKRTSDRSIATSIAQEEINRQYPNGKNFGITYAIDDVGPYPKKGENVWLVVFDLPRGPTDQSVRIYVNVKEKTVLLVERPGA